MKKNMNENQNPQMQMPFFPTNTKLINSTLGYFEKDGTVFYLHNGLPIYIHAVNDMNYYRFVSATLVENGLCTISELAQALCVNEKNIQRYVQSLRLKGAKWFFNREEKRGQCYKLDSTKFERAQEALYKEVPVRQIAKELQVTEGALRHHIRTGKLKKKKNQ
jgi:predicted ArsR family transcriptional regulator